MARVQRKLPRSEHEAQPYSDELESEVQARLEQGKAFVHDEAQLDALGVLLGRLRDERAAREQAEQLLAGAVALGAERTRERDEARDKSEWAMAKLRGMNHQAKEWGIAWRAETAARKPASPLKARDPWSVSAWLHYLLHKVDSLRGEVLKHGQIKDERDALKAWHDRVHAMQAASGEGVLERIAVEARKAASQMDRDSLEAHHVSAMCNWSIALSERDGALAAARALRAALVAYRNAGEHGDLDRCLKCEVGLCSDYDALWVAAETARAEALSETAWLDGEGG